MGSFLLLAFVFVLNFGISWFNAVQCGRAWDESKSVGGFMHGVVWSGAVMSAAGFTWCFLVIATFAGMSIPLPLGEDELGATVWMTLLTPQTAEAMFNLGYLIIIFPVLGSGLVITAHSWVQAYHERSLLSGGVATYNTFAQIYNISQAVQHVPSALESVGSLFSGSGSSSSSSSSSGDSKGKAAILVVVIVALCVLAGCLTTYNIISRTRTSYIRARAQELGVDLSRRYAA